MIQFNVKTKSLLNSKKKVGALKFTKFTEFRKISCGNFLINQSYHTF